ncbi:DUF748 domain-containing protein [Pseudodesulfovibrio sp. JC047]|uniref:DUF748 domain-containing protein n=1 Tax=Pseudodesulfovibrio sp. JC047 TaxID=2683199 RepID=UPI0013D751DF|nr:DUF748 domain-containing protein [Pseudodesulfovibrio sp. JC047]NDV18527.1 DUF748 domain-containing protein [Pseudodesulfovibrio sp. JC047]
MLSFLDMIPYGSPRLRRIGFWLLTAFIAYTLFGFFAVPPLVNRIASNQLHEALNRPAHIETVSFNPFTYRLEISGLHIDKLDAEGSLLSVKKIVAAPGVTSIWEFAPVISYLQLDGLQLDITFFGDGKYSISDILEAPVTAPDQTDEAAQNTAIFPFALYGFEMTNATITFDDRPHKKKHVIKDMFLRVPFTSSFAKLKKEFTQPKFTAIINGDPVELKGRTLPFDETLLTEFELGAVDVDLNQYWQYVPLKTPLQLKDGQFTSDISLFFERPEDQRLNLFLGGGGSLTNLEFTDPKEKSVVSVKELAFEMERFSLGDKALTLTSITLDTPYFKVIRDTNNIINWATYFPGSEISDTGSTVEITSKNETTFSLDIRKITMSKGTIDWEDRLVKGGFKRTFSPLSFTGSEITTAGNHPCTIEAMAGSEANPDAGILTLNGVATIKPLSATVTIAGENIPLPVYSSYINNAQPLIVDSGIGTFSASVNVLVEGSTPALTIQDGSMSLSDLSISKPNASNPSLGLKELTISGATLDLKKQAITMKDIVVTDPFAKVIRGKNGQLDLIALFVKEKVQLDEMKIVKAAKETWSHGWSADCARIQIKNGAAHLRDQSLHHPADLGINGFTLDMKEFSSKEKAAMPFSLDGKWSGKGTFSVDGTVSILPLWSNGRIRLNGLGLRPLDGYLAEYTELLIAKGAAFANIKYSFKNGKTPKFTVTGDTALRSVSIKDTFSKKEIIGLDALDVKTLKCATAPNTLSIGEIALAGPRGVIHFSEDGQINIRRALRLQDTTPKTATTASEAPPAQETKQAGQPQKAAPFFKSVKINKISMTKGAVSFKDESVHPDFSTNLTGMNLLLTEVNQSPEARPKVDFKGNIGPTPMSISGVVNPVITPIYSDLVIAVNGMELVPLTPYTLKNLAYPIEKGRLYADISFQTENWLLNAENKFYIEQLVLGAKDNRPDAPNVPVEFGLSLLQDGDGNMELNLPIRGELNDPDFQIGGIVFKAIVSLLFKALASPFTLIGSMFGGGENMDFVVFEPGRHALDDSGQQKMETIIKALTERKKLTLEVDGVIDPVADKNGLVEVIFETKIKQQKYDELSRSDRAENDVADMVIAPEEYEDLLFEAYADEPDEEGIKPTTLFMTDRQPVDVMEKFIRDRIVITDELLHDLAMDRANTVKSAIIDSHPELKDRVFLLDRKDAAGKTGVPAHRADLGIN